MKWRYKQFGEGYPGGNRFMTFEVTSIGAPIHNIQASLYLDARRVVKASGEPSLIQEEINFDLTPLYTMPDPLNAGQSQEYDLSLRYFEDDRLPLRKAIKPAFPG